MKESPNSLFPASTICLISQRRSAGTYDSPLAAVLLLSFALLGGCSSHQLVPAETALADQMTDCAYLSTRHVQLANKLGVPVEKGYASIGYYRAAGIVLSSRAHADGRFDEARRRYLQSEQSIVVPAEDLSLRPVGITSLEKKLAECAQLSRIHRDFISPKVAAFIGQSK